MGVQKVVKKRSGSSHEYTFCVYRYFLLHIGELATMTKHRSRLSAIHLVAIVKTTILFMYGMDNVLRPFVDDIRKLV